MYTTEIGDISHITAWQRRCRTGQVHQSSIVRQQRGLDVGSSHNVSDDHVQGLPRKSTIHFLSPSTLLHNYHLTSHTLLQGDEPGSSGSQTGPSVSDGLVGDRELSEVVTGHLRLDFYGGERLSVL